MISEKKTSNPVGQTHSAHLSPPPHTVGRSDFVAQIGIRLTDQEKEKLAAVA